jgi:hypothetical protein
LDNLSFLLRLPLKTLSFTTSGASFSSSGSSSIEHLDLGMSTTTSLLTGGFGQTLSTSSVRVVVRFYFSKRPLIFFLELRVFRGGSYRLTLLIAEDESLMSIGSTFCVFSIGSVLSEDTIALSGTGTSTRDCSRFSTGSMD